MITDWTAADLVRELDTALDEAYDTATITLIRGGEVAMVLTAGADDSVTVTWGDSAWRGAIWFHPALTSITVAVRVVRAILDSQLARILGVR